MTGPSSIGPIFIIIIIIFTQDVAASLEMAGKEISSLRSQCRDHEFTLEEMGVKIAESKLLADEMV